MAGIYIHVPFCRQACHYCDFHFSTNLSQMENLVQGMIKELQLRKDYLAGQTIQTIYFGGGTPSLLTEKWLSEILEKIHHLFPLELKEVTLEANPDDLNEEKLQVWKSLGIDRLSLGIQSFQPEILKFYNRSHSSEQAKNAISISRNAGFEKFSFDLIYGFPAKDHRFWEIDLELAILQNPGHISAYSLTVESKTVLGNWLQKGKFTPPDEDFVAEQFEFLQQETEKAGYEQYEISNFGKPGQWALHNTNYWKGIPYLGIGPSAHSFDGKSRGSNPSSNPKYIKSLESGETCFEIEEESLLDRANEQVLTALRTSWGLNLEEFQTKYSIDLAKAKGKELEKYKDAGWLIWENNTLSLTKSGKLLADSIAAELFIYSHESG
ncbi:oxygen-independent coproporphyrinogen-3 oxidase [Algoriphagus boseongensis]|uniref:Heme chaperone HemW n=1 Tax=Algoriphagus boseongensis TaxID=1442587 RepID=A0A4R6T0H1_9BACT|nr:radical SAM family heme chaperone HemW [Algoriphagus boseongensis]TDQ13730.1 oxygen-independent coproporphyrinogen-3 oxidase [Algoriphagus boseongensis]